MVARSDAWVCSRSQGQPCGERSCRTTSSSCRIRSVSSAMVLVAGTIRRRLDLHQPFGVEQATHPHQRGHGLDGAEYLAVGSADLAPAARRCRKDPGPGDIVEAGADAGQCLADDAQALPRLLVDIPLAYRRAIVRGRRTPADLDRR